MSWLASQPPELLYLGLLFLIFVVPRLLQRFRLPPAITALAIGAVAGMGFGLFHGDFTVEVLATLGIVSLFLFAGLELDVHELRRELPVLSQHIGAQLVLLAAASFLVRAVCDIQLRAAVIVSLALITPSAGFILDSLPGLGFGERARFWVRSKAIASEIVSLAVLFVTLQSDSLEKLGWSTLVLGALLAGLPLAFRVFASVVVPHAPKSEFAFLVMIAILCAYVTRRLGVYYLVGAFIVGVTAQRFRERLPAITSDQMITSVEMFASFFVPFYFFRAGLHLHREDFGWEALGIGITMLALMLVLRVGVVAVHRRVALDEPLREGMRIGLSMMPTLVFTLVLADIARERYAIPQELYGALIVYTLANTLLASLVLRGLATGQAETSKVGGGGVI